MTKKQAYEQAKAATNAAFHALNVADEHCISDLHELQAAYYKAAAAQKVAFKDWIESDESQNDNH